MNTAHPINLADLFSQSCNKYAARVAYRYRPRFRTFEWTYEDVFNHATYAAHLLQVQGIQKGDRVILIGVNSPFWVAAFFGIQLRGAIAVPLSPESKEEFIQKIAEYLERKRGSLRKK